MSYFFLNRECFLEQGKNKSVIYNLYSGDIYVIEKPYSVFLSFFEKKRLSIGESLNKILGDNGIKKEDFDNFLNELVELNLGDFYDSKVFIEKVKPSRTKKDILIQDEPPILELIWLKINNSCNLNCSHCFEPGGRIERCGCTVTQNGKKAEYQLCSEDWKKVISEAVLFTCQSVQFIGGETLLDKEFLFELISYAVDAGIPNISLVTNGTLVNSETLTLLMRYNVHLVLPFYCKHEKIHDSITGVSGSYKKQTDLIKQLVNHAFSFNVEIILLKENQDYVDETIEFLKELGVKSISAQALKSNRKELLADNFKSRIYKSEEKFNTISKFQFFRNKESHSCWHGKAAVMPNGNVLPCMMAQTECVGNIKETSFRNLLRTSDLISKYWDLTKDKIDVCKECEFRFACSDCRVIESIDGSLTGKNKFCTYHPTLGEWARIDLM